MDTDFPFYDMHNLGQSIGLPSGNDGGCVRRDREGLYVGVCGQNGFLYWHNLAHIAKCPGAGIFFARMIKQAVAESTWDIFFSGLAQEMFALLQLLDECEHPSFMRTMAMLTAN
jgi:hypothetical protein